MDFSFQIPEINGTQINAEKRNSIFPFKKYGLFVSGFSAKIRVL